METINLIRKKLYLNAIYCENNTVVKSKTDTMLSNGSVRPIA